MLISSTLKLIFYLALACSVCSSWAQPSAEGSKALEKPPQALSPMQTNGFKLAQSREGQCTLCHSIPNYNGVMGNLGPSLEGVANRLNEQQLRQRLSDSRVINPLTIMPPYFSTEGLNNVDPKLLGKPLLNGSEFEEIIAYLKTLQ
jgi:sulfur-oxidizing protein SoxX